MPQHKLAVWIGSLKESCGRHNYTVILGRDVGNGQVDMFDSANITLYSSEYPDRARYEADCAKWTLGICEEEPNIVDYDANAHSGYQKQPHELGWKDAQYHTPDQLQEVFVILEDGTNWVGVLDGEKWKISNHSKKLAGKEFHSKVKYWFSPVFPKSV